VKFRNRKLVAQLTVAAVGLVMVVSVVPAAATPVCPTEPRTACGGRIFPEPGTSIDFVQWENNDEYASGLNALETEYEDFVRVTTFEEYFDDEKATSAGGRPLHLVEITDFSVPDKRKVDVMVSMAVHGPERAGLEGSVRYMEDLAMWATNEPDHLLKNGTQKDSTEFTVEEALKKVHIYMSEVNPDGWAAGDNPPAGTNVYVRGNDNGFDLNRQWPTMGWLDPSREPLTQPEAKTWHKLQKKVNPIATVDLHGELDSANGAFADIMYPAGQWNPKEQAQEETFARHMKSNIERYFEQDDVPLADVASGAMIPAEYATGYDVVGYDDSGFMGDYFTQHGAVDLDIEHFLSHTFPNGFWAPPLEQAHVAAARAEIETLIVEALVTKQVRARLNLGKVGYMFDPKKVTSANGYGGPPVPKGYEPKPYEVTRMQYFKDLSNFTGTPLRKVDSAELHPDGLKGLDTFVIANKLFPKDPDKKPLHRKKSLALLKKFVENGGNLILTDRAVRALVRLGLIDKGAISQKKTNAGHINISDQEDPYVKGVHSTASQTYYEVALGYPPESKSPHWVVTQTAWEEAGGKTIATVQNDDGSEDDPPSVGLGRLKVGKGTIGIFAALLPKQREKHHHYFGLADYGVTVAGGQILNNMIRYEEPSEY
jgi:Zinc carboxypeptidase